MFDLDVDGGMVNTSRATNRCLEDTLRSELLCLSDQWIERQDSRTTLCRLGYLYDRYSDPCSRVSAGLYEGFDDDDVYSSILKA